MKKQKGIRQNLRRARNRLKRKAAASARNKEQPASSLVQRAGNAAAFGVSYCIMTRDIFEIGIGHVILGRTISPNIVATGLYLVDVYCLGIKNAFYVELSDEELNFQIDTLGIGTPLIDIAPECARKLVEGSIAYAKELGFKPHRDYFAAEALFGNIDAADCWNEYEFGKGGKPFYVSGPNDTPAKVRQIMRTLTASVGEENFDYLVVPDGL